VPDSTRNHPLTLTSHVREPFGKLEVQSEHHISRHSDWTSHAHYITIRHARSGETHRQPAADLSPVSATLPHQTSQSVDFSAASNQHRPSHFYIKQPTTVAPLPSLALPSINIRFLSVYDNQATWYGIQHIWCLSQARINWEGCGKKGIWPKNGGWWWWVAD